jgi:hypothetical protein
MWVWRRTYEAERASIGSIMTRPDCVAANGRACLDANRLAEEIVAFQEEPAAVGILFSIPAHIFNGDYMKAVNETYHAISSVGRAVEFVAPARDTPRKRALAEYDLVVVPPATHVQRDTLDALATHATDGGTLLTVGNSEELLAKDPMDEPLPEDRRTSVLEASVQVNGGDLPAALRDRVDELVPADVRVVDAETGENRNDVEWRTARREDRTLLNVANYTHEPVTLRIERDGDPLTPDRELIAETAVDSAAIEIGGEQAALFELPR